MCFTSRSLQLSNHDPTFKSWNHDLEKHEVGGAAREGEVWKVEWKHSLAEGARGCRGFIGEVLP